MSSEADTQAPRLRFPEFTNPWGEETLNDISEKVTSGSRDWAQYYSKNGALFLRMTNLPKAGIDLLLDDLKHVDLPAAGTEGARTALRPKDILISITAELGKIGIIPNNFGKAYINQHTALLRPNIELVAPRFVAQNLASPRSNKRLNRLNDSGAKSGLNLSTVRAFPIKIPSLPEQKKIADFLGAVDAKLAALREKEAALIRFKRGLMQALFSQTLRFTRKDGSSYPDWNESRLGDVAKRQIRKNTDFTQSRVLTNSAVQGVVDQGAYFEKDIANANNLDGYYVIEKGDFVYNPRISVTAPVGPIKRNDLGVGVMSPLYTVFRFNSSNTDFVQQYFETTFWHRHMCAVANYGARHDRMNITVEEFLKLPIPNPHPEEQMKIANSLRVINAKIAAVADQINQLSAFKKGLLQQMFV